MLEDFSLVDKRMILRNKVSVDELGQWQGHMVMTYRKNPAYILLNADELREMSYLNYEKMFREIWEYLS